MRLRIPPRRRLVLDFLHFAREVPLFPLERKFRLDDLVELREHARPKISWVALFMKAYGLLAADWPQLRQTFVRWPWPHLYEHPHSVAMVAVSRTGEPANNQDERLFFARFTRPENQRLVDLQDKLEQYKREPVGSIFRRQVRLSHAPTPVRRAAWWWNLNVSPAARAHRAGTFGLSTVAGLGSVNRFYPSVLTSNLTYGPVDEQGHVLVTLLGDHRVIDGAPLARAMRQLESVLHGPIARELAELCVGRQAA